MGAKPQISEDLELVVSVTDRIQQMPQGDKVGIALSGE